MKFSDIDFSAISRMMDSMSDEEKDRLNNMAQEMMDNMKNEQEPEQEEDMYAFYLSRKKTCMHFMESMKKTTKMYQALF